MVETSVKSEILEDPQTVYFSEVMEENEGEVKAEADSQEDTESLTTIESEKPRAVAKEASRRELKPVYVDMLPGRGRHFLLGFSSRLET